MAMSTSTSTMTAAEQAELVEMSKRAAAFQAVKDHLDPSFRYVGIGSGSTVVFVVEAIAALGAEVTSKMGFVPTGQQSSQLIAKHRLRVVRVNDVDADQLDVAFDGADEVDEDLNLIKGGGGCLLQEKIVASAAKKFVCVADFRKMSPRLGTNWKKGIPIEVHPMAADLVLRDLQAIGSQNPHIRDGAPGKAGPLVTDNGNFIIDAPFHALLLPKDKDVQGGNGENGIWSVEALATRLRQIVGVMETGIFYGPNGFQVQRGAQKPVAAYFGMADGTVQLRRAE